MPRRSGTSRSGVFSRKRHITEENFLVPDRPTTDEVEQFLARVEQVVSQQITSNSLQAHGEQAETKDTNHLLKDWSEDADRIGKFLNAAEADALSVCKKNGLPHVPGRYRRSPGSRDWEHFIPPMKAVVGETRTYLSQVISEFAPDADSEIGIAASILLHVEFLRSDLKLVADSLEDRMIPATAMSRSLFRMISLHRDLVTLTFEFGLSRALWRGVVNVKATSVGTANSAAARKIASEERYRDWQKRAEQYWADPKHFRLNGGQMAEKIRRDLRKLHPDEAPPAVSTIRQKIHRPTES